MPLLPVPLELPMPLLPVPLELPMPLLLLVPLLLPVPLLLLLPLLDPPLLELDDPLLPLEQATTAVPPAAASIPPTSSSAPILILDDFISKPPTVKSRTKESPRRLSPAPSLIGNLASRVRANVLMGSPPRGLPGGVHLAQKVHTGQMAPGAPPSSVVATQVLTGAPQVLWHSLGARCPASSTAAASTSAVGRDSLAS
jgi:hypothetical protein